jgi:acyl CoA:acetate/3-ketoacid CoA transferase beta subunit
MDGEVGAMLTPDERLVFLMSNYLEPQDIVVQGMATPIVFAAFLLARAMHAPDIECLFTVGNTFFVSPAGSLGITGLEAYTAERGLRFFSMLDIHCDVVPGLKVKEFLRPAQVDGQGNTNNAVIGKWDTPKVRLPGAAGIPDVLSFNPNIFLYVVRHDRRTLVAKVDFVSGVGTGDAAKEMDEAGFGMRGPRKLLTPEAVFELAQGAACLTEIAPRMTVDELRENTGFCFTVSDGLKTMPVPSNEDLHLLREVIDPLGVRKLEVLAGVERLKLIREVIAIEHTSIHS